MLVACLYCFFARRDLGEGENCSLGPATCFQNNYIGFGFQLNDGSSLLGQNVIKFCDVLIYSRAIYTYFKVYV